MSPPFSPRRSAPALPPARSSIGIGTLFPVLLAALVSVSLTGCTEETPSGSQADPKQTQTLVFLDQSISTEEYTDAKALFADSLRHIVQRDLRTPGDRLSLFLVHRKTLSKAHRVNLKNNVSPPQKKEFDDEQALEQARYRTETEQFLQRATSRLQKVLESPPSTSAKWTDLWGTLGVAGTELSDAADEHRLYYLSDMFESMPGPARRNFDRRPPQSRTQARRWARADADTLDTFMILRRDRLQKAHVRVLLGTLATKPHAQDVKFYWRTLFQELGLAPRQIDYN